MTRSGNHEQVRCCADGGADAGVGAGAGADLSAPPRKPTAAERARTLVAGRATAVLGVPGLVVADPLSMLPTQRTVTAAADVILRLPAGSPALRAVRHAADDELAAVLELTDIAPVAVANRVRGRAWIAGWLTPLGGGVGVGVGSGSGAGAGAEPGWLKLEVGEVSVEDAWGSDVVEPDEFAAAEPDLLAECEAELLQHLAVGHGDELRRLCSLIDSRKLAGRAAGSAGSAVSAVSATSEVVPLALDRFGLRIRLCGDARGVDAFFPFAEPASDMDALRRSLHALFDEAYRSGSS